MQNPNKDTKPGDTSQKPGQEQKLAQSGEQQKQPQQQDKKQEQKR